MKTNVISTSDALAASKASAPTVAIHFGASWCAPSEALHPRLVGAAALHAVPVFYVDADATPSLAAAEGVEGVPRVAFYRNGGTGDDGPRLVAFVDGAKDDEIALNLRSLGVTPRAAFIASEPVPAIPGVDGALAAYLKYLITRASVSVFFTGTPSMPRCGFTSKLAALLQTLGVQYTFYDIMTDEAVCQGLKKYSDWPTFPQVYSGGELIGGLDVCAEMHSRGELAPALKGSAPNMPVSG